MPDGQKATVHVQIQDRFGPSDEVTRPVDGEIEVQVGPDLAVFVGRCVDTIDRRRSIDRAHLQITQDESALVEAKACQLAACVRGVHRHGHHAGRRPRL